MRNWATLPRWSSACPRTHTRYIDVSVKKKNCIGSAHVTLGPILLAVQYFQSHLLSDSILSAIPFTGCPISRVPFTCPLVYSPSQILSAHLLAVQYFWLHLPSLPFTRCPIYSQSHLPSVPFTRCPSHAQSHLHAIPFTFSLFRSFHEVVHL